MGIFSRKVEQTDQEIADSLAASGLSLFTQARDNLVQANELNEKIIADSVAEGQRAAQTRDGVIAAARSEYDSTMERTGSQIASAMAAQNQNNRALDALNGILGS